MKLCPWCNTEYPIEFFEEHHKNHIHEDNSSENVIEICVKCHKRHHFESGYDTVILKKDFVKPRTLKDELVQIDREEFLKAYRERQCKVFKHNLDATKDVEEDISKWIEIGGKDLFVGKGDLGFRFTKDDMTKTNNL
jgi:hypothetical protein